MRVDKDSPRYHVVHWRNVPETTENELDDFLAWLQYDQDSPDLTKEQLDDVEILINAYLGRNMSKVQQGERAMLDQWIKAAKGE